MTLNRQHTAAPAEAERELFLSLLAPVKTHLYNFIRKTMNFSADADDVFQDTLLKGFRYFHSYDRKRGFKTWIFAVAHNLVKDRFRQTAVREQPIAQWHEAEGGEQWNQAPGEQTRREAGEIYHLATQLQPRAREVFYLYYYNEFSVAEIMEVTGLSRANVKFTLHKARQKIKSILEVTE